MPGRKLPRATGCNARPPGPRALYVELKRRYTGSNNGRIILSHRDAAAALSVHRNTMGPWFDELEEHGFIRMTQAPHLGPSGVGKASVWALDEAKGMWQRTQSNTRRRRRARQRIGWFHGAVWRASLALHHVVQGLHKPR